MNDAQQKDLNDRIRNEAGDKECIHGVKLKDCTRCFNTIANELQADPTRDAGKLINASVKDAKPEDL